MTKKQPQGDLVSNRRALHDYEILETYEVGIVLTGTEIKSLKDHGGSLQEAYVKVLEGEVWLIGAHIAPYLFGNIHNHVERRDRKLLLHKREINKVKEWSQEKGCALIPLAFYLKKGMVKLRLGAGKGKKLFDKREALKSRDEKRQMQKALKQMHE